MTESIIVIHATHSPLGRSRQAQLRTPEYIRVNSLWEARGWRLEGRAQTWQVSVRAWTRSETASSRCSQIYASSYTRCRCSPSFSKISLRMRLFAHRCSTLVCIIRTGTFLLHIRTFVPSRSSEIDAYQVHESNSSSIACTLVHMYRKMYKYFFCSRDHCVKLSIFTYDMCMIPTIRNRNWGLRGNERKKRSKMSRVHSNQKLLRSPPPFPFFFPFFLFFFSGDVNELFLFWGRRVIIIIFFPPSPFFFVPRPNLASVAKYFLMRT